MRKTILPVLLSLSLLFTAFASSCSSGVDKNQYDRAVQELNVLREKKAKAQLYALFLDLLMSQFYKLANLPSRYQFSTIDEWSKALDTMAANMADAKITSLLNKMKTKPADEQFLVLLELENYVIDQIATTLQ
jgi:hypothetical protein